MDTEKRLNSVDAINPNHVRLKAPCGTLYDVLRHKISS